MYSKCERNQNYLMYLLGFILVGAIAYGIHKKNRDKNKQ
jgi:hypothetical protein